MTAPPSRQEALHAALLKSERLRFLSVLAFLIVLIAVYSIRIVVFGLSNNWLPVLAALFGLAFVEIAGYRTVEKALRTKRSVPAPVWIVSIIAEICVPAAFVAFSIRPDVPAAYRSLATPWVLVFFPFIMLSTLRLNPWLSRFAGCVAFFAYLAGAYQHGWRPAITSLTHYTDTQTAVLFYALILLASGFLAGAVAGEIRKNVEAALLEVEVRQQLKQVEHDLDLARSIQRSLLPQDRPRVEGFEIAAWNLSADATGGDFFDWKQLPDGRLVVLLADVTGHGIGPALLAAVCRAYARASFSGDDSLIVTMQNINRLLSADFTPPHFATFVAAICNEHDSTVELLSAGQGPLLWYSSRDRDFREIQPQAIPLGLMREINCASPALLQMLPGDLVLLITDGFVEWSNRAGEEYGKARIADAIRRVSELKPEDIIAELYRSVVAFADGTKQPDDLTAIVIKRAALAAASDKHLSFLPQEQALTTTR